MYFSYDFIIASHDCLAKCSPNILLKQTDALLRRPLTLILAHIRPGILDIRNTPIVDGICISIAEFKKHFSRNLLGIKSLWFDLLVDLSPKLVYLSHKF